MEIRKARLVGNSIHISIPPDWLKSFGIVEGEYIQLELQEKGILVKPLRIEAEKKEVNSKGADKETLK